MYITSCINIQKMQIPYRICIYGDKKEYLCTYSCTYMDQRYVAQPNISIIYTSYV